MIVKDCERSIGPCLKSIVPFVDEVIVVDTGSTDTTKQAVLAHCQGVFGSKVKILDFTPETHPEAFLPDVADFEVWKDKIAGPFTGKPFLADFGAARQFGWEKATGDYLLWVDSDDVVEGGDQLREVVNLMEANHVDVGFLRYDYAKDHLGNVNCQLWRERILRRSIKSHWSGRVHEVCLNEGSIVRYEVPYIVHERDKHFPIPAIKNRNLKILLHWVAISDPAHSDPRILFYLGGEERFHKPDHALLTFKRYFSRSGSADERSTAHVYCGEIHEAAGRLDEALAEFAQATLDNPGNPDGFFGAARIAYLRARLGIVPWHEVVDRTERGFTLQSPVSVMANDPQQRRFKPYIYLSVALVNTGQYERALKACDEGLKAVVEGTEEYGWLTANRKVCVDALRGEAKPERMKLSWSRSEPLEAPARDMPFEVMLNFSLQLWKRIRDSGDHDRGRRLLENLPVGLMENQLVKSALAFKTDPMPATRVRQNCDIVLWTGPGWERWSPKNLETGIGGSEVAAVNMARELVRLGHRVRVYSDCKGLAGIFEGVEYIPFDQSHEFECDVLIASRVPAALTDFGGKAKLKVLWVHDIHCGEANARTATGLGKADKIFCLSEWHRTYFLSQYPFVDASRVIVTRNGLDLGRFWLEPIRGAVAAKKKGNRLVYSSSADRGLLRLLELFPRIRAGVPDAELHVYYGFHNWETMARQSNDAGTLGRIAEYKRLMASTVGVFAHGSVGQQELADAFLAAKVWAYPTWFSETSCISAMEAQAAGCVPVTTALAALRETVKHGVLIDPPPETEGYAETFVRYVVSVLKDHESYQAIAEDGRQHALANLSWTGVAHHWQGVFLSALKTQPRPEPRIEVVGRKLRIAAKYGLFASRIHGPFDVPGLFSKRGLTGSESCFFNVVRGLAERGHQVDATCDTGVGVAQPWNGAMVYPVDQPLDPTYDAYLAWNEPNLFHGTPRDKLRVCVQQLNDFSSYTHAGFDEQVDLYVMPSNTHREYLCRLEPITPGKTRVIPNSINLDMLEGLPQRNGKRDLIWCSSPDRGLHILLTIFPEIRKRVPDATLKIFYRFKPWFDHVKDIDTESGARARQIGELLNQPGVELIDSVPNQQMYRELAQARALAYTCDTISFTEGFSVSIMDACATGCVPIISDVDALYEIYKDAALIVPGRPRDTGHEWINLLTEVLLNDQFAAAASERARNFARFFDRKIIAAQFEKLLLENI
jgi:glycosyltransferase involved in cell wall biosynthesis